ncbi:hypothetical protein F5Y15DRAFT_387686 [Xylariaceae sp. FL0016]|nr:hypothetical protein F5Y15DRAFT_387686 [Xylariaceae sp. FL0016]
MASVSGRPRPGFPFDSLEIQITPDNSRALVPYVPGWVPYADQHVINQDGSESNDNISSSPPTVCKTCKQDMSVHRPALEMLAQLSFHTVVSIFQYQWRRDQLRLCHAHARMVSWDDSIVPWQSVWTSKFPRFRRHKRSRRLRLLEHDLLRHRENLVSLYMESLSHKNTSFSRVPGNRVKHISISEAKVIRRELYVNLILATGKIGLRRLMVNF